MNVHTNPVPSFLRFGLLLGGALFASALGCSADIHDNVINIPNATVNAMATGNVDAVTPQQPIPLVLNVENVYLVDPMVAPPPEHEMDAGHVQIYLDDTSTPPILVTAQVNVEVTIPTATPPGKHKLICRVHKHNGTPTSTKVEVAITVAVTIGADGGVSVDANATGGASGVGGTSGAGGSHGAGGAGGAGG